MNIRALVLSAFVICSTSFAEEEQSVMGAGVAPCADVIALLEMDADLDNQHGRRMVVSWAHGFLSALNVMRAADDLEAVRLVNEEASFRWLKNYCEDKPLDAFLEATFALYMELAKRQGVVIEFP